MEKQVAKTFFDEGFEFTTKPTFKNNYNLNGAHCGSCNVTDKCALKKSGAMNMCFDSFHRQYSDAVSNMGKSLPISDAKFNLYVDNIAYHLNAFQNPKKQEMDEWDRLSVLYDVCLDSYKNIVGKRRVICRILGRQALDILRSRGYEF